MKNNEFESGIDAYQKSIGKKCNKTNNKRKVVLAKRICPYCRSEAPYSNMRMFCKTCGRKLVNFVIRDSKGEVR